MMILSSEQEAIFDCLLQFAEIVIECKQSNRTSTFFNDSPLFRRKVGDGYFFYLSYILFKGD